LCSYAHFYMKSALVAHYALDISPFSGLSNA
jgi:hypothetical protein